MGLYLDEPGMADSTPADRTGISGHGQAATAPASEHASRVPVRQPRLDLLEIIEGEIIPRLFLAHRDRPAHKLAGVSCAAGDMGDSLFLAQLFLSGNTDDIVHRLQVLLDGGMRRDRLYLDLLAPVPQTLSRLWSEGSCSFDEIAIGLCCMENVLQEMHQRERDLTDPH